MAKNQPSTVSYNFTPGIGDPSRELRGSKLESTILSLKVHVRDQSLFHFAT